MRRRSDRLHGDDSMSVETHAHANGNGHAHDHGDHGHGDHGHELPFWRKYIFSVDHKVIGIQYTVTALVFLMFGFCLMMLMRWQLAYPGQPLPFVAGFLKKSLSLPNGVMDPAFYNSLGAMHGTIMVFLG